MLRILYQNPWHYGEFEIIGTSRMRTLKVTFREKE